MLFQLVLSLRRRTGFGIFFMDLAFVLSKADRLGRLPNCWGETNLLPGLTECVVVLDASDPYFSLSLLCLVPQ